jgi:hypothetical protein
MMMGPACFSDRAVHVATHGFLLLIYTFGVFYHGVCPFRSCGSGIAMTGADDAHGNVLLRPYIVCARQEMCLCSFDVSHLCHRWFDVMIVC